MNGSLRLILPMFAENDRVIYRGMCGIISFVGNSYVVVNLPPAKDRNSARLVIYSENYSEIIRENQSTK